MHKFKGIILLISLLTATRGFSQELDSTLFKSPVQPALFGNLKDSINIKGSFELNNLLNAKAGDTVNLSRWFAPFNSFRVAMKAGDENNTAIAFENLQNRSIIIQVEKSHNPKARKQWVGLMLSATNGDGFVLKGKDEVWYWKKIKKGEVVEQ